MSIRLSTRPDALLSTQKNCCSPPFQNLLILNILLCPPSRGIRHTNWSKNLGHNLPTPFTHALGSSFLWPSRTLARRPDCGHIVYDLATRSNMVTPNEENTVTPLRHASPAAPIAEPRPTESTPSEPGAGTDDEHGEAESVTSQLSTDDGLESLQRGILDGLESINTTGSFAAWGPLSPKLPTRNQYPGHWRDQVAFVRGAGTTDHR